MHDRAVAVTRGSPRPGRPAFRPVLVDPMLQAVVPALQAVVLALQAVVLASPGLVVALASRQLPAKPFEVGAQIRNLLLLGRIPLGGCHAKVMPHFPNLYKLTF